MANNTEIQEIELLRLAELEKQRAYNGINTTPEVLIEIAELRQKYGASATAVSRDVNPVYDNREPRTIRDLWNEVDFLRAICSSILVRVNIEAASRRTQQVLYTVWLIAMTLMLFYILAKGL